MLRKQLILLGFIGSAALLAGCNQTAEPEQKTVELETLEQKVNYIFGLNLADNFQQSGVKIEPEAFVLALKDKRDGVDPRLNEEEITQVMREFQEQAMAERQKQQEELAKTNLAEAEKFLAENKAAEGVQVTDTGLQYRVIEEGEGAQPDANDTVTVHYTGKLLDDSVFDSSYKRNQPQSFTVNGVIIGWGEALQMMKEGAKWELYIPPSLAYGPNGNGPIPPNAALIFEVELLEVEANEAANEDGDDAANDEGDAAAE